MSRGTSVLAQLGGLMLAALLAVLLISFGVVLLTPTPEPQRMTVAQAAAALSNPAEAARQSMSVRLAEAPPKGRDSALIASALARQLGRPPGSVRAYWIDDPAVRAARAGSGQTVMIIAGQDVVVDAKEGGFTLRSGAIASVAPSARVPPFRAAIERNDGRWLIAEPEEPFLGSWRFRMLAAFLISALLLAPFVWLVARRLTRPIRALARAAERTGLDEELVVPSGGPSEVRAAAEAMHSMHRRLAAEAAERTRMLAAVAHDLRTPLTGIRIRAETIPEPERQPILRDVQRIAAMIDQLLDYARGREVRGARERLDASELVERLVRDCCDRHLPVEAGALAEGANVLADPEALQRALENLIENAVRYGGSARISVEASPENVSMVVEDNGPGLPEEEIARVVEPFHRLEGSRSRLTGGTGLGLAIARDVAAAHSGVLRLRNRVTGGLSAVLSLPALPESAPCR